MNILTHNKVFQISPKKNGHGKRGRHAVETKLNWEEEFKKLPEFYEEVLAGKCF